MLKFSWVVQLENKQLEQDGIMELLQSLTATSLFQKDTMISNSTTNLLILGFKEFASKPRIL